MYCVWGILTTQMCSLCLKTIWTEVQISLSTQEVQVYSLSCYAVHCHAKIIPMEVCGTWEQMQKNPFNTTQHEAFY